MKKLIYIACFIIFLFSCKKDFINNNDVTLAFSTDSILFDTLFTTIGSSTHKFKIYNNNNGNINISEIFLAGGNNSNFRINIDGISSANVSNIELLNNDSLYIFVEVTIDPNNTNNPLVIVDSIMFLTNNNYQAVHLAAWGQDAYFYTPNDSLLVSENSYFYYHNISSNTTLSSDKPHVIYGYMGVTPNNTLTIAPGSNIHFHANSGLIIFNDATLKCLGDFGNSITIEGDRLEPYYENIPGQWDRIWLAPGSINNEIRHTTIKNGTIGLHADTIGNSLNPTLSIYNSIIKNMSSIGIFGQGTNIYGENVVVGNCGQYGVVCNIGGNYNFKHCTFSNYWNYGGRNTPNLLLNNWYEDINGNIIVRNLESANFYNCIVYGNINEEVVLDKEESGIFNYYFDNCLLKLSNNIDISNSTHFNNVLTNQDPNFKDIDDQNFQLDTLSPAIDIAGIPAANDVPYDLLNIYRFLDNNPDIGAYERIE